MKKLTAITLLLSLLANASCAMTDGLWRYRLTLVVDDNGTQKSGSAVVECHGQSNFDVIPDAHKAESHIVMTRGEATAVELKGGILFAILKRQDDNDYACDIVSRMFPLPGNDAHHAGGEALPEGIRYYRTLEAKRDVPFDQLPMLVRFRDIADPKTVEAVDPNDLAKSFGPGVRLVKATIEMTKESVKYRVDALVPVFQGHRGLLDGNRYHISNDLANQIGFGHFRVGQAYGK